MAGIEMDAACVTYEAISFEQDIFPKTKEPIWILGKQYITDRGRDNFIRQNEVLKHLTMPEFQGTAARKILLAMQNLNSFVFCRYIEAIFCYFYINWSCPQKEDFCIFHLQNFTNILVTE